MHRLAGRRSGLLGVGAAPVLVAALLSLPTVSATSCPVGMSPVAGLTNVCEQVFTSDGNFTVPAGAELIEAFIVGGGGGGGGGSVSGFELGGGGGGGGGNAIVAAAPNNASADFSITVGDGGGGGAVGANGNSGQTSSVDWGPTSATAVGGDGGAGGLTNTPGRDSGGGGGDSGSSQAGGAGATRGGGGGGGGLGTTGQSTLDQDGAAGGAGARPDPTEVLFGNLLNVYGGGGGGGATNNSAPGAGGAGGGGAGGSSASDSTGVASPGSANTGGGGGGGGLDTVGGRGRVGGAGGSGLVIIRASFGPVIAAPIAPEISLSLTSGEDVTCSITSVSGQQGDWVQLPSADSCTGTSPAATSELLGWATRSSFPIAIAQRQVVNGWGAYETFGDDGNLTGVFIPAGGSTLLSASGTLFAIVTS